MTRAFDFSQAAQTGITILPAFTPAPVVGDELRVASMLGGRAALQFTVPGRSIGASGGFTNVMDFGATGDGVTNDRNAIAAAVASLNGRPGVIYFPPGRYVVSGDYIVIHSGVRITGAGSGVSIIQFAVMNVGQGGVAQLFVNTLFEDLEYDTDVPTTPANQTDHDLQIDNLGFDYSSATVRGADIVCFLLARDIKIFNITAYNPPAGAVKYEALKFIGCDNVVVSGCIFKGVTNAVDCWKGCTRVTVSECAFDTNRTNAHGNGGLINWNATGSGYNDFGVSRDLKVSNTALWLYDPGSNAMFLDALGAGSQSTEMLVDNVTIRSMSGMNTGIVCRGYVDRLKVRGLSFSAAPGADLKPFLVEGIYSSTPAADYTDVITTVLNSNLITIHFPSGVKIGPGNYMRIQDGVDGNLPFVGCGLSLKGYYPVVSATDVVGRRVPNGRGISLDEDNPVLDPRATNVNTVVVRIPDQVANTSGVMAGSVNLLGYFGHPHAFDFESVSFDGISNQGKDLMLISGDSARIAGVVVSTNYQGNPLPQYRSIVAIGDSVSLKGDTPSAVNISGVVGAPGTVPLQAGWDGDNSIAWDHAAQQPILSTPAVGSFDPVLRFDGSVPVGIVYTEQAGTYTKTGPLVIFALHIAISNKGTSVGAASISGLPFVANSWGGQARGTYTANFTTRITQAPSGTTTPVVYTATVGSLTYTIAAAGTDGASGTYDLVLSGGAGTSMTGAATFTVIGRDKVASITRTNPGSGGQDGRYPMVFTGSATTPAEGDVLVTNGAIAEVRLLSGGSGYLSPPVVSVDVPGLAGAVLTAVLGVGGITEVNVKVRGVYTTAPTASTSACPGLTGAAVTVAVNTTGLSAPSEIIGRIVGGHSDMALHLDVDQLGMRLTSGDFSNSNFLRMAGWYLTDK